MLNYTEDSGSILLIPQELQNSFSFTVSEGFNTGYLVTLTIVNRSNSDPGELILPNGFSASGVTINGANTSQITVEYIFSPLATDNTVPVDNFTAVFRAVQILFRSNAPRRYCVVYFHEVVIPFCLLYVVVCVNRQLLMGVQH